MSAEQGAPATARSAPSAVVSALSHDGRGIAKLAGKTLFIEDALPGEEVTYRILKRRNDYDEARVIQVLRPAPERVAPRCAHFGVCGGCSLQHMEPAAPATDAEMGTTRCNTLGRRPEHLY